MDVPKSSIDTMPSKDEMEMEALRKQQATSAKYIDHLERHNQILSAAVEIRDKLIETMERSVDYHKQIEYLEQEKAEEEFGKVEDPTLIPNDLKHHERDGQGEFDDPNGPNSI